MKLTDENQIMRIILKEKELYMKNTLKDSKIETKILISCCSALNPLITLTPFNVSVNRPVTSLYIFRLSLNIGLIYEKAFKETKANIATGIKT